MFKKKRNSLNIDKTMAAKIPYLRCYEEEGMIETRQGVYTKSYLIEDIRPENISDYDTDMIMSRIESLINALPDSVTVQFCIHNKTIEQEEYLKKVLVKPDKSEEINRYIDAYNRMIVENASIGHNNIKGTRYFTIALAADLPEIAANRFRKLDQTVNHAFAGICGIEVRGLKLNERLQILYSMLNPERNSFGLKADLRGDGKFTIENMVKMKLTTKDMVASESLFEKKDHLRINNDTYARVFFISTLPAVVSNNLISDLMNISSNMLFSMQYEAFDTQVGFDAAASRVSENTVVTNLKKRETIRDRKNKVMIQETRSKDNNEQTYFEKAALDQFKNAMASGNRMQACSFVLAIFADDVETLERDTKLLHISISKFACQIKMLALQQLKGFQSVLPLANCLVDVKRVFSSEKLAALTPLNIQEVFRKDGLYNGLNAINDNLILYNRKNSGNMAGLIAGVETSGKTFQCKREIFNALIGTNDRVVILSMKDDYDGFIKKLGGNILPIVTENPFHMEENYGLMDSDRYHKSFFLEAMIASAISRNAFIKDELDEKSIKTEGEVRAILDAMDDGKVDFEDIEGVLGFINRKKEEYPLLRETLYSAAFENIGTSAEDKGRLQLCRVNSPLQLCIMLDYLWNRVIRDLKQNVATWIFIDSVDSLACLAQGSAYLTEYVGKCNSLKTVFTAVIQSTVRMLANESSGMYFDELVGACGYFKLLNQGAIERKKYAELLTIPNSLLEHITNREPGKGVVLTSASNTAFDDSFLEESQDFLELFT